MYSNLKSVFLFSSYEFDPRTGELTQYGRRVRLNKQTANLLAVLLVHAGSLVTRQQIKSILWPDGEQVDYDAIINNGISRLRYLFKDNPNQPKFIERIPKRGYRMVIPVVLRDAPEISIVPAPVSSEVTLAETPDLDPPAQDSKELQWAETGGREVTDKSLATNEGTPISTLDAQWYANEDLRDGEPPTAGGNGNLHGTNAGMIGQFSRQRVAWLAGSLCIAFLLAGTAYFVHSRSVHAANQQIAIAIAPLDAIGTGAEALSDSFRLDLSDSLAQLPQLQVRSTHSVDHMHTAQEMTSGDGAKLHLDMILFGRFMLDGRRCHLQFEIVRAKDAGHVASLQYDGTVEELGSIRDRIQQDIFHRLQIAGGGSQRPLDSTSDAVAYESYLEARYQLAQQTPTSFAQAVKLYGIAMTRDPGFVRAQTGLAQTHLTMGLRGVSSLKDSLDQADTVIAKALVLDPGSADAHSILGLIHFYRDWDLADAELEERKAIRLNPHQATYHQWLATVLCEEGHLNESLREAELAVANDPGWPMVYVTSGFVAMHAGDNDLVLAAAHKLEELLPGSDFAHEQTANMLWYSGHNLEAITQWREMAEMEGDAQRVSIEDAGRKAFQTGGVRAYAKVRLDAIRDRDVVKRHPNDFQPAEWYANAAEIPKAMAELKQLAARHDPDFIDLIMVPAFQPLYKDAEFKVLTSQIANLSLTPIDRPVRP